MNWHPFDGGQSSGQRGSEDGIIIRDDEHADGARITLERGGHTAPYSITCGIYGWFFHTRFFSTESAAQLEFQNMKDELAKILARIPLTTDPEVDAKSDLVAESISHFVDMFP